MIKKITLLLTIIATYTSVGQTTIGESDLFTNGPNSTWVRVLTATTAADPNSGDAQTLEINITSLPFAGANYRVYKTTGSGGDFFGNAQPLTLGTNTITVGSVTFLRAVKFQFSSGDVEFDALSLNGTVLYEVVTNTDPLISTSNLFEDGPTAWPRVLTATTTADLDGGAAQNLEINITSLPTGGANYRLYRTNAAGNVFFGNAQALTEGLNTITVPAVAFERAVKFQFSSGDIRFNAISLNNTTSDPDIDASNLFDTTTNATWTRQLIAASNTNPDSQLEQTLEIYITKIPAEGADYRVYKTNAAGNDFFGNATALKLGYNTLTVTAVTFNRAVRFQFNATDIQFNAISLNNETDDEDIATSDAFSDTGNSNWGRVITATENTDPNSGLAQTLAITITKLPATGANYRVYKTNAAGNDFFGNATALKLGLNTLTVTAVAFTRTVKFQFSTGDVEYNSLNLNNSAINISWDGSTDTSWGTAANWSTNEVPNFTSVITVGDGLTNYPVISSDISITSITLSSGASLLLDETSSLTVSGNFTNNGGIVTLNSTADDFSSLIVQGTATGDIVYNRFVNVYDDGNGGGWDFVGAPAGMTIADFIAANGANIQVLGDDYALAQYDNATGQYTRYPTALQTGSFTPAQGYALAMAPEDLPPPPSGVVPGTTAAFTGTIETTSQSINIVNNHANGAGGRRWNLVSNPFPSFIKGNTDAGTNNFLDTNSAVMDDTFTGVYGWNGSDYDIYNLLDGAFSIAPGQGFWVAALSTSDADLDFTAAMRTTTGTGDFIQGPQLLTYNVALKLYSGEIEQAKTNLYFRDGLTLGLDPGYDAGAYNQSMKLSTRLAQGSQETAFAKNAMGMDAMQNTRVPLEIRQNAGQAFTISIADIELPEDISVYLEDTLNGTLTSLKDGDFELTAQSDLSGAERFFIVFKDNSVLSSGDTLGINALNVYKANTESFVTIAGITPDLGKLDVTLYSMLGVVVKQTLLNTTTATQRVSTDGLSIGLYVVQIKSGNQIFNKKVIIK